MSWSRAFDRPISLPGGAGELVTLRDAGEHVAALPKAEQHRDHWRTATDLLLAAAERGGIIMLAEIAMRQALNHGRPALEPTPRRKPPKKYRLIGSSS